MGKANIEFIDPNLPADVEKFLPSILAQAIINKIQNDKHISSKVSSKTA